MLHGKHILSGLRGDLENSLYFIEKPFFCINENSRKVWNQFLIKEICRHIVRIKSKKEQEGNQRKKTKVLKM